MGYYQPSLVKQFVEFIWRKEIHRTYMPCLVLTFINLCYNFLIQMLCYFIYNFHKAVEWSLRSYGTEYHDIFIKVYNSSKSENIYPKQIYLKVSIIRIYSRHKALV